MKYINGILFASFALPAFGTPEALPPSFVKITEEKKALYKKYMPEIQADLDGKGKEFFNQLSNDVKPNIVFLDAYCALLAWQKEVALKEKDVELNARVIAYVNNFVKTNLFSLKGGEAFFELIGMRYRFFDGSIEKDDSDSLEENKK